MADIFKALSDETRRQILQMLKEQDLTAGQISEKFQMSKPAISKHLEILRNASLIESEKQGQFVLYTLNTTALQNTLKDFLNFFESTKKGNRYAKQKHES